MVALLPMAVRSTVPTVSVIMNGAVPGCVILPVEISTGYLPSRVIPSAVNKSSNWYIAKKVTKHLFKLIQVSVKRTEKPNLKITFCITNGQLIQHHMSGNISPR